MAQLKIFSKKYIDTLFKEIKKEAVISKYQQNEFLGEHIYALGTTTIEFPQASILDPAKSDLENSISLYTNLKLDLIQASDPRIWTTLSHTIFLNYLQKRWPLDSEKNLSRIKSRYFLQSTSLEKLSRNGLSRLWWYSHLTQDESRKDTFELTKVMLKKQDLTVGLTERAIGACRNIRLTVLQFLRENSMIYNSEDKIRLFLRRINLVLATRNLTMLKQQELIKIYDEICYDLK